MAQQLGVDETTIHNWEVKATEPALRHLPKIIVFLGYNPLLPANTLAEQIVRCRKTLGLSRERSQLELENGSHLMALRSA